jgi:hypothetical protein
MRLYLSAVWLALVPGLAAAQEAPLVCPVSERIEKTEDLSALPAPVSHSLQRHVSNLSPPGSPFNGGDALRPGQTALDRRLIAAFHRGSRWVIAYEAAGVGYHLVVVGYDVAADGKTSTIAFKTQTFPALLCVTVDKALTSNGPIDRFW